MKRFAGILTFALLLFAVTAWPQTTHNITLNWTYTQASVDNATGFNVYRATTTGGPYAKMTATPLPIATLTYVDASGVGGVKYFYVVTAIDSVGDESAFSNEVSGTFLANPAAPQGVTIKVQ